MKRTPYLPPLLVLFVLSLLLTGAVFAQDHRADLKIVATTTQAADIARILTDGADGVQLTALMGAGVDPHLYQATESDIVAMNAADVLIYNGLHLEGQFDTVFEALNERGIVTIALGQYVKDAGFIVGGFDLSDTLVNVDDPHFWFDPRNWELATLALADDLAALDPDNADLYRSNAEAYAAQLQLVFDWANAGMRRVPEEQRYLVTSHDAFQYFGAAFGWQQAAIQGLSTQDEAGVGDIQQTVDFVIDNAIPVIFVESSLPPDTVEAVVAAVADEGGTLRVGLRELYSDAMGDPEDFGGTYVGMLAENVYTLLQSYQCAGVDLDIPEWPEDLEPVPEDRLLDVDCE